jgi:CubicO group peptidase (beta-lactamase class C family)
MCKQAAPVAVALVAVLPFLSIDASAGLTEAQVSDRPIADADAAVVAQIDAIVRNAIEESPTAGLSVGVSHGGKTVLVRGFGRADLENDVPATADTVYCIGSLSKQFGSAALLRLVEAKRLSLDDDLLRWLPDYPAHGKRITIENLLRHTSGIPDFEYEGAWHKAMALERTDAEVVATFAELPLEFEPGTDWKYSTSGYYLVGMILARAGGKPLPDVLATEVFSRAGLTATRTCDHHAVIPHRARGYTPTEGGMRPADLQIQWQFSIGGGICSTVTDMLAWSGALESGRIVSPDSYRRMYTGTTLPNGTPVDYGYGLASRDYAGHPVISHSGHVAGFTSYLSRYPSERLTIVVLANSDTGAAEAVERRIADLVLGVPPVTARPIATAALAKYAGEYRDGLLGTLVVEAAEPGLKAHVSGFDFDFTMDYVGEHSFAATDRSWTARFVLQDSRAIRMVLDTGGLRFNLPRATR